jgi:phage head maturation protease
MNKPLHVTIPIAKIDEDQRMVYGYATVEEIDAHGEIIGYEASKKAFGDWIGNIRDMHQDIAVGKNMETEFDDEAKGVWIGAKISESDDGEQAWIKVKEGVYSGFSIGGKINDAEIRQMSVDGKKKGVTVITDYDLGEVSLVDNPACPSAIFQMVKSVDGHLQEVEKIEKGLGRPVHWWEKQFKFSDSQNIMKADFMSYNEDSMSDKRTTLTKGLWEASMLVDLAMCLSDYIYWKAWEGEDMTELKDALTVIQSAAAKEITEPENFPEVEVAIENATKALNISKKEELVTMSKDIADRKKSVVGQEDRDEEANVVVTAEENGKPADPDAPVVDAAEGAEDSEEEVTDADASEDDSADDDASDEDAEDSDDGAEDAEEPAADDKDKDGKGGKGKKSASATFKKSTANDDLAKSILSGVEALIEKSVTPLKEEIERLKKQPAVSKAKSTFTVKKGEDVDGSPSEDDSAEGKLKAEFDQLNKRADELALDPNAGTPEERMQVGFKLRKLSRQLDPASVAQNAAVRATFNRGQ